MVISCDGYTYSIVPDIDMSCGAVGSLRQPVITVFGETGRCCSVRSPRLRSKPLTSGILQVFAFRVFPMSSRIVAVSDSMSFVIIRQSKFQ